MTILSHPRFVTVEGVDGAGKSSHIPAIGEYFREAGFEVVETREPGGTPLGETLREILLHQPMDLVTETMLMFASRREHIVQVIAPALERGCVVVCDRFSDSSWAYQAGGRQVPEEILQNLQDMTHPGLEPGLTLLFDLPVEVSRQRLSATGKIPDNFESETDSFFGAVRDAYKKRIEYDPKRFRVIDSRLSIPECSEMVRSHLDAHIKAMKPGARPAVHRF